MHIILDNIIFSLQRAGGISGVWAKLIERLLQKQNIDVRFVERHDAVNNIYRASLDIPTSRIIHYEHLPLVADRYSPVRLKEDAPFIFHSSYYRTCNSPQAINAITLHDFIYEDTLSHLSPRRLVHSWQKSKAIHSAQGIATVSDATNTQLQRRYAGALSDKHIAIIYNPPVCIPCKTSGITSDNKYLLFIGGRNEYKNFHYALKLARHANIPLTVAGAPLSSKEKRIIAQYKISVFEEIYPSVEKLSQLYTNALCLLYPSSDEGFGIPIIEAQKHRCPVIINTCDACLEVGGNGILSIENNDIDQGLRHLIKLQDPAFRQQLTDKGYANSQRFGADKTAEEYLQFYSSIYHMYHTDK